MEREIRKVFGDLKREGIIGLAIVDKEGEVIESVLPSQVHLETFAIMGATIIGAASSAMSELDISGVDITTVYSGEGKIIYANTDVDLILCVVTDKSFEVENILEDIDNAVENLNQIF